METLLEFAVHDLGSRGIGAILVYGATIFDSSGTLRQIGVRLVPSPQAEDSIEGFRGMRHTAGRRYSFDDPLTTIVIVSEDGPVTVLRNGQLLGASASVASPLDLGD